MKLKAKIGKELLFFDGAMGTLLQEQGLPVGYYPERWNLEKPDIIRNIHKSYLEAGCHILKTNTFGANSIKFGETPEEIIKAGISLAREAISQTGRTDAFVAFDMSSTGKLLAPLGDLPFEEAYNSFSEMVRAGNSADAILIETMTDTYELKAAVLAAKENSDLPVFASVMLDRQGKLLTGGDVSAVVALLEGLGVDALGLNCGFGPKQMLPFLKDLMEICSLPVLVNPNAGLPVSMEGKTIFDLDPVSFTEEMQAIADAGPWLLGGCCGTTPKHLAHLIASRKHITPPPVVDKGLSLVSSYTHAVDLCKMPRIVGEKLNPTGNKVLSSAVKSNDMATIIDCAVAQKQAGADVLDVNVGLPGLDEIEVLPRVVCQVQEVVNTPLMIDTSNGLAMEETARLYNGKPFLNSVSGKEESLNTVLPIAAKYGGVIVALAIDDNGIPKTAHDRLAVAKKIIDRASEYGISKKNIFVDTLTMTISADPSAAQVTLEALSKAKSTLGVGTVLGVSNISFGLPQREEVTRSFYTLALEHGLDAAIVNPFSVGIMSAYKTFLLLRGMDKNSLDYISFAKNNDHKLEQGYVPSPSNVTKLASNLNPLEHISVTATPSTVGYDISKQNISGSNTGSKSSSPLIQYIVDGMKERAGESTKILLQSADPMDIINGHIIPALTIVGDEFETGASFLPQLLMSAEAAGKAFEVIKTQITADTQSSKGKILLATVKGDIHDIGKNIVKVLLENYGYQVYDLGRDVDPQDIIDTAVKENIPLIGLSALMTTTVPSMEATIQGLKAISHPCKVVVGGAVLSEEYANSIFADYYAKDAMATVHFAENFFGHSK